MTPESLDLRQQALAHQRRATAALQEKPMSTSSTDGRYDQKVGSLHRNQVEQIAGYLSELGS